MAKTPSGFEPLLEAETPAIDPENITGRVDAAKRKFRSRHSSGEDRRDALRDLADVLERLRPKVKDVLKKEDERELFNILNNFGIRHHNNKQKTDYDKNIFYSWMFYYYLSAIHAATRLIERQEKKENA
jgi:hypothetical protein